MKIISLTRLKNTANGNPQWLVRTSEGAWQTKPDAQIGHTIRCWEGRDDVWLTIDGYGYIVAVSKEMKAR